MNTAKISGSPVRGLTAATIGFFFGSAAISLFGPSATKLNEVMDLSPSMMGLLVAIPTLSGSLLRIPFGASVDENGGRKSFLLLMILSVIGLTGLSILLGTHYPANMQGTYWLILVFGCLSGCGVATFSVGAGQSSYWFPKNKQGFALGIFGGLGTLGAGVFAIVLPLLLHSVGFVSAYYIWTAFMIAGTILYFIISCNAYHFQFRKQGYSEEASKAMAIEAGQELFPAGNMKQSLLLSARIPETWILVSLMVKSLKI
jgi:NNP family nitrate/nitrite transporter-like MFS transporter